MHYISHTATDGETEEDRKAPSSAATSAEQQSEWRWREEVHLSPAHNVSMSFKTLANCSGLKQEVKKKERKTAKYH